MNILKKNYNVIVEGLDRVKIIDWSGELKKYPLLAAAAVSYWRERYYIPQIIDPPKNKNLDSVRRILPASECPQFIIKSI